MPSQKTVVGLGEILWDLLPTGRQLGGAPANFAYCSHLLGSNGVVVSRVGTDELGREIRELFAQRGIGDQYLQNDAAHPTGTVPVELDARGQPSFEITFPAAWDFIETNPALGELAQSAAAVCFGSLAQRSARSRSTILKFLESMRAESVRVFDVNLRQSFYSVEIVRESIMRANAAKLNHTEVPVVAELLGVPARDEVTFCRALFENFPLQWVCVTRGEKGSLLADNRDMDEHRGFAVSIADTVGAGDAFTAGLVHERLRGGSLESMNDLANRMGAWVASCSGAMPALPKGGLQKTLSGLVQRQVC